VIDVQPKHGVCFGVNLFGCVFYGDLAESFCVLLRHFCDKARGRICNSYNAGALQLLQISPSIACLSASLLGVWVVLAGSEQFTLAIRKGSLPDVTCPGVGL
jgi:hypothetical protein